MTKRKSREWRGWCWLHVRVRPEKPKRVVAGIGSAATREEGEGEKAAGNYGGGVRLLREGEGLRGETERRSAEGGAAVGYVMVVSPERGEEEGGR
ncbi:hypothetical protein HAX54_042678 [Datura stramonium]|uniref:Uncharacterized protein n=1 Tax=Datura stramonium TaxID=4076 RepID=A0ABS8W3H6_DATST|nr:hypothetical protein [Datura stramonium]